MADTQYSDRGGDTVAVLPASAAAVGTRPARALSTQPASQVMTDFMRDLPVTVAADRFIDDALRDMIVAGVRALLVVRADRVVGLITSYDIQGERPLQFLASAGFSRHDEIAVSHIMTPWAEVPKLDLAWVADARVADVDGYFQGTFASHVAVVERGHDGKETVRGLFSRTHIERQLVRTSA